MKMGLHERGKRMKQIRLDEMSYEQKLQYVEPKNRKNRRISMILMYFFPFMAFLSVVIWECISTEDISYFCPFLIVTPAIILVLVGDKLRKNTLFFFDEIMDHRVWFGYIDTFQLNQTYEFVDKNGQSISKQFTNKDYEKYADKDNICVIYIPELDVWHIETKDTFNKKEEIYYD